MTGTTPTAPLLRGSVVGSFAYTTIKDRLPLHDEYMSKSQGSAGDAASEAAQTVDRERREEASQIMSDLAGLKYAMVRDRLLEPLPEWSVAAMASLGSSDGHTADFDDVSVWNAALMGVDESERGWFRAPWLLIECYMYRLVRQSLLSTRHWANCDPFAADKQASLAGSTESMLQLAQIVADGDATNTLLRDLIQFSLWGNQSDLSLLVCARHSEMHKTQVSDRNRLAASQSNIIVNDLDRVVHALEASIQPLQNHRPPDSHKRIVIVLDNAGFELFADLCLADALTRLIPHCHIVFEAKAYPWFVSDTTPTDLAYTIDTCSRIASGRGAQASLGRLVDQWRAWLDDGTWVVQTNAFWTTPAPFWQLPTDAPDLMQQLRDATFIFFKGDLNYRKMVHDAAWPPTTPLTEAIGPLATSGIAKFVLLRTCKSDTIAGLAPSQAEMLDNVDKNWMVNGKFGMIQAFGV